jgi:hypothetical protein
MKHFTRSRSPLKNKKSPPSEVINVSEDDNEEEQLRVALEMSLQEASSPSRARTPSQSGSRSAEKTPYFGPARETDYREDGWGMVLTEKGNQEVGVVGDNGKEWGSQDNGMGDIEVPAVARRRVEGQPGVLNSRPSGTAWLSDAALRLGGLMTILHKIPKAREEFLLASPRDPTSEEPADGWWKGGQELSTIGDEESDPTGQTILREAAKIMAFLDDSERSYGKYTPSLR